MTTTNKQTTATSLRTTISTSLLLCLSAVASAIDYNRLLPIVSQIESSDNPQAVGDGTKARGLFQFHASAWLQASLERKKAGKKIYAYAYAHDPFVSRQYAEAYLSWLAKGLRNRLGREPYHWEVYASFNRGLGGFSDLDYNFSSLPKHTQKSCRLIASTFNEPL
jgi:hypothetical protein